MIVKRFISFPLGHLYSSKQGGLRRWYNPQWFLEKIPSTPYDPIVLREAFEKIRPDLGRIEKWVLRKAFHDDQKPYLPKHILYRQKEQFSDGVGYSWIVGLKDHANKQVTDSMLMNASFVYPENTPTKKEGYYYRTIFEKYFPKNAVRSTVPGGPSVACSTAKAVEWDAEWSKNPDSSGRAALGIHAAAYEKSKDVKTGSPVGDSPQKLVKGVAEKVAAVV